MNDLCVGKDARLPKVNALHFKVIVTGQRIQ